MEPVNSPYTPKNYSTKKDNKPIQPSVYAGPSEYPDQVPQTTPNIPTYEHQDKSQKKLLDLQIYEQKKPNFLADKQANIALQPLALSSPFMPPQFQSYFNNMMKQFYTPFIYKDYNINIGGPNADRMHATVLYEDVLPPNDVYTSYKSLVDRNNLADYIRSTFITIEEGEPKNFKGEGQNSLNSRLKLIELTPNNSNDFNNNPISSSANDFLLYHSCYPIVYDKNDNGSQCSKTSTGISLRVYNIYRSEIINLTSVKKYEKFLNEAFRNNFKDDDEYTRYITKVIEKAQKNKFSYNTIRDKLYYEWIRNNICKKNVSPNFVQSYCYFIDQETKIKFNDKTNNDNTYNEEKAISQLLLILTESPEQSIAYWSQNITVTDRNVQRQVKIGIKSDKIWESVIAQILLSFYVMLEYSFVIYNMNFKDTLYVKDVNIYNQSNKFWVYNYNNIKYYIPNNGYLLMIDNNFSDLLNNDSNNLQKYKIFANFLRDENEDELDYKKKINKIIYKNLLSCTNKSFFTKNYVMPEKSQMLINDIHEKILKIKEDNVDEKFIEKYEEEILYPFLGRFMNNRIGTPIRAVEINNIDLSNKLSFNKGDICVYEVEDNNFIIVLYIKDNPTNENCYICLSKDRTGNIIKIEDVDKSELYHYSSFDEIQQDIVPGDSALTIDNLIETYII
jgi:hypothetical protein